MLPHKSINKLFAGFSDFSVPILSVDADTYTTAVNVANVPATITAQSVRKIALAMGLFSSNVNIKEIEQRISTESSSSAVTPIMFEYALFERARSNRKKIVLPESNDERILRATEILLRRDVADIILLGVKEEVLHKSATLGLDISKATIIDPMNSSLMEEYVNAFYEMRKAKGLSLDVARDSMMMKNYFATMMIQQGFADGMVSGAIHTTQETIRPALQIIKTKPGISIVSSLFFMCLDTRVLVYGDCAVNQDPNAEELAQIAISSADTAMMFGIVPKIAMLSYSTGDSGKGEEVEKVRMATKLVKEQRPDLLVEGPIQYDAAIDPDVAKTKLPNSKVAGQATIFIFPDLNTGNNTYKAVQRSSGAVAIGPVLQGLRKPVNDLSRGCLVPDIVNTVAITAIQAQTNDGEKK
jgi:phosphate acetyltransferase